MTSPNGAEDAICPECVEHDYFPHIIREEANSRHCACCGRRSEEPIALTVDRIANRLQEGLELEWSDVRRTSAPWDGEDQRYVTPTRDTYDLLHAVQFYAGNEALHDQVVSLLPDREWSRQNPLSLPEDERLSISWDEFSNLVKHRHRYLFFPEEEGLPQETVPPSQMLSEVGGLLHVIDALGEISSGQHLYRVRIDHPRERFETLAELCSPPVREAKYSNRMSPAGVSAFYASYDPRTAVEETDRDDQGEPAVATVGIFSVTEDIPVVDLTQLPEVPSLFDRGNSLRYRRRSVLFLHNFVAELTSPVSKDDLEHIEYVPSQVVTEFLRDRFEIVASESPKGIVYPSATDRDGPSLVLFYSHRDFTQEGQRSEDPPLELVATARWPLRT